MASISVAAEWQLLGNRFYRKIELYQLQWKHIDLTRNKVACASYGGPVAIIRDDSKIVQLYAESSLRKLRIFNSAGNLISETAWKHPGGRIIGMSWTDDLTLISIVQDGTIYRYNVLAECLEPNFSMGKDCFEENVVDCLFWGNGGVCLTESGKLFCVADFGDVKPHELANPGIEVDDLVHRMALIEPQYTVTGNVEVLLGVDNGILIVDEDETRMVNIASLQGSVQRISVSPNGRFFACFIHDGCLVVLDMEFQLLFQYQCETDLPPQQMAWCGLDSVLLYLDDVLLMVGPSKDCVRYFYDEPVFLIPECDGVRILSNTAMELLQRVPESTVSIFKIGSTTPASLLFDALDHFDRRSAKADENLRLIRKSLAIAVEVCIDAAGNEFLVSRQRKLLRAASYGQAFCSNVQRDCFMEMCTILRVLNAVRDSEIGFSLSIHQYKALTAPVLINRLINAHHHLLALRISEYLGMNQETVIMHWACLKITASLAIPDANLLDIILCKLKLQKGISYAAVAAHADKTGRRKLASMLVEQEPRSDKQVPLLLSIGEEDTALIKAIESGDTDLVYLVLFHIWHKEVALLLWKESWELGINPMATKGSPIHGPRIKVIEKAQHLWLESKEHTFESKIADEHAKLLRIQHELETSTKQHIFVDSSISDTIRTCIVLGNHKAALKVKTDFKVSEKRWYWLKAFALATIRDWDALEMFSKEKKPPVGYKPFVEACIEAKENLQAVKYIPKLSDPRERGEAYARIGMAKEAAGAASQTKDGELLARLKFSFSQSATGPSIFDTLRDTFSFQVS